jgi:hypothetical protein
VTDGDTKGQIQCCVPRHRHGTLLETFNVREADMYLDDDGNYIVYTASDATQRRAMKIYQEGLKHTEQEPHIELGQNAHHGLYSRIRRDKILFQSG